MDPVVAYDPAAGRYRLLTDPEGTEYGPGTGRKQPGVEPAQSLFDEEIASARARIDKRRARKGSSRQDPDSRPRNRTSSVVERVRRAGSEMHPARGWYDSTLATYGETTERTRKTARGEIVTRGGYSLRLTSGEVVVVGAAFLLWEAGQAIAHGLAGLDPANWAADIEDAILGNTPRAGSIAHNTVGGILETHLVELLNPAPPAAPAPSNGSGGSSSPSNSTPPPGSTPTVWPIEPIV